MPTAINCLSKELKAAIREKLEDKNPNALDELLSELEAVPPCSLIGFTHGRRKGTREPSEYQKFIGECMRKKNIKSFGQAPAAMRECAAEWRRLKR